MQYQMNFVLSLLAESEFKNRNIMETNMQKPDNNLVWAILATVLCCLPFGIVAIIKSTQVDSFCLGGHLMVLASPKHCMTPSVLGLQLQLSLWENGYPGNL